MESYPRDYNADRWYEPQVGLYTRADPIGLGAGVNVYSYTGARPTILVDPLGLDTAGCDLPPWVKAVVENPCVLECCAAHDECFDTYNCSDRSWYSGGGVCGDPINCARCNIGVGACFAKCTLMGAWLIFYDSPNRGNYYCAARHKYVSIPGDFPDRRSAQEQCERDNSKDGCCDVPPAKPIRIQGHRRVD